MEKESDKAHSDHVERSKKLLEKAEKLKNDGDASSRKNSSSEKISEIRSYMKKMKEKIDELEEEVSRRED